MRLGKDPATKSDDFLEKGVKIYDKGKKIEFWTKNNYFFVEFFLA